MTLIPLKPVSVLVLELLDVGLHVGDLLLLLLSPEALSTFDTAARIHLAAPAEEGDG